MQSIWARLLMAVGVSFATLGLVRALTFLPYSITRDAMSDALSFPGGAIAGLIYSEGIHTAAGSPAWSLLALVANLLFYAIVWYVIFSLRGRGLKSESSARRNA
jgi:hypothetical protein